MRAIGSVKRIVLVLFMVGMAWAAQSPAADGKPAGKAESQPVLAPGQSFTLSFPDMPRTLASAMAGDDAKPVISVFLPTNYDRGGKHPLLVYLGGGDGGRGYSVGVPRKIAEDKDFICVNMPLFKEPDANAGAKVNIKLGDADFKYMWPLYKRMLARLDAAVPNIDPAHRFIGGFSNGAHTTAGLIDNSEGEFMKAFSAFYFVEGGGRCGHLEYIKGRPLLLLYGEKSLRPERLAQIKEAAASAGVIFTIHEMKNTGHAFPESQYPVVAEWLRGPAMATSKPAATFQPGK